MTSRAPTSAIARTTPIGEARPHSGHVVDRALARNPEFLSTAIRRGLLDATLDQTARLRHWRHDPHRPCRFPPFDVGFYRSCYWPRYRYCDPYYGYSFVSVYHDPWWWREPEIVYVNTYTEPTGAARVVPSPTFDGAGSDPAYTGGGVEPTPQDLDDVPPDADLEVEPPRDGEAEEAPYESVFEAERRVWIEEGTAAFSTGRYDDASRSYAQAMLSDERDGFVKCLYAASKFAAGDYGLAAVALRRALLTTDLLITTPPDVRAFYGDDAAFDAHLAALETTVRERPTYRDAAFLLAYWNYSVGRPERADGLLRELIRSDERDELCRTLLVAVERARSTLRK